MEGNKILTVKEVINKIDEDFYKENNYYLSITNSEEFAEKIAISIAKLHVVAALKAASENARCCDDAIVDLGHTIVEAYVEPDSILNAYPLDLIK